ncbi:MAG: MBL fold metallo-hydrolase, partial [bacterium]
MEYIDINNKIAIISGFNNIGVIKNGKRTILIDSGLENRAAGQICRMLEEKGLKPSYIINTHSHADHCGGNNYIQKNFDVEIIS